MHDARPYFAPFTRTSYLSAIELLVENYIIDSILHGIFFGNNSVKDILVTVRGGLLDCETSRLSHLLDNWLTVGITSENSHIS
jgi:hypothetical protein